MDGELRMSKGSVFQMVGAAMAKPGEPKCVRTRGTDNELDFSVTPDGQTDRQHTLTLPVHHSCYCVWRGWKVLNSDCFSVE